jgi:hypothetical protein
VLSEISDASSAETVSSYRFVGCGLYKIAECAPTNRADVDADLTK